MTPQWLVRASLWVAWKGSCEKILRERRALTVGHQIEYGINLGAAFSAQEAEEVRIAE